MVALLLEKIVHLKLDPYSGVCLIDFVLICRNDNNLLALTTRIGR
jgi:hypothetical protein